MKPRLLRIALLLVISLFISLACESTSSEPGVTPTPVAVTMENMCEYDGKLVTVEGQLLLPGSIGCTSEEPVVCQFTLYDQYRQLSQTVEIPVKGGATRRRRSAWLRCLLNMTQAIFPSAPPTGGWWEMPAWFPSGERSILLTGICRAR